MALARQPVVERDAAGQVADVGADGDRLRDDVPPEDLRSAGRRMQEPEQQPDERALAGAIGSQEAEHLAGADVERDVVQRGDHRAAVPRPAAVVLGQPARRDRGRCRGVAMRKATSAPTSAVGPSNAAARAGYDRSRCCIAPTPGST